MSDNKKDEMIQALRENYGLVSRALKCVSATRDDHENWLKDADYAKALRIIEEEKKDHIEWEAIKQINEGNANVTVNVLKTKLKDRGYGSDGEVGYTSDTITIGFVDGN